MLTQGNRSDLSFKEHKCYCNLKFSENRLDGKKQLPFRLLCFVQTNVAFLLCLWLVTAYSTTTSDIDAPSSGQIMNC